MAEPLIRHTGRVAVLMRDNIDTDQIIPSREMKTVSKEGLSEGLFAGWRYTEPGGREPDAAFVLNQPQMDQASILISGENFGCGSSREHAVWALQEYGFRVIIAKSFGEIFHGNCLRNGILPIVLDGPDPLVEDQWSEVETCTVDLATQTVTRPDETEKTWSFEIGAYPKRLLMEGLDAIGLTLKAREQIEAYLAEDRLKRPWLYSAA